MAMLRSDSEHSVMAAMDDVPSPTNEGPSEWGSAMDYIPNPATAMGYIPNPVDAVDYIPNPVDALDYIGDVDPLVAMEYMDPRAATGAATAAMDYIPDPTAAMDYIPDPTAVVEYIPNPTASLPSQETVIAAIPQPGLLPSMPQVTTAAKTGVKLLTSPFWMAAKYNSSITFKDNAICTLLWADYGEEADLDALKEQQAELRSYEQRFPAWYAVTYPTCAYTTETAVSGNWRWAPDVGAHQRLHVNLHISRPSGMHDASLPLIICFHGGGMCKGSPLERPFPDLLERYSKTCNIVSVDYRLAYEGARWPDPIDDAMAALKHCVNSIGSSNRIVVTGYSAGAYLAVACALKAKAEGINLHHVLPIAPNTHIDADGSRAKSEVGKMHGSMGYFDRNNSMPNDHLKRDWHDLWVKPEDRKKIGHDLRTWDYKGFPTASIFAFDGDATSGEAVELHEKILAAGGQSTLVREAASHIMGGISAFSHKSVRSEFDKALGVHALQEPLPLMAFTKESDGTSTWLALQLGNVRVNAPSLAKRSQSHGVSVDVWSQPEPEST